MVRMREGVGVGGRIGGFEAQKERKPKGLSRSEGEYNRRRQNF